MRDFEDAAAEARRYVEAKRDIVRVLPEVREIVRESLKKSVPRELYDWFRLDDVDKCGR